MHRRDGQRVEAPDPPTGPVDVDPTFPTGNVPPPELVASFPGNMVPPIDEPQRKSIPQRGRRMRVLGNGEGDYCFYVISDGTSGIPAGALLPIDGVPRFPSAVEARRWLLSASGSLLANKQIILFKALDIIDVLVTKVEKVQLLAKTKFAKESDKQEKP